MGVENARIEIEGGHEVPIVDGSAQGWAIEIHTVRPISYLRHALAPAPAPEAGLVHTCSYPQAAEVHEDVRKAGGGSDVCVTVLTIPAGSEVRLTSSSLLNLVPLAVLQVVLSEPPDIYQP